MIKPDSVAKHGNGRKSDTCLAGADITSASTFENSTQAQLSPTCLLEGIQAMHLQARCMSLTYTKPVLFAQQILMDLNRL